MRSSRQVAGLTRQLNQAWRSSRELSTIYPIVSTTSSTATTTRRPAGYLSHHRASQTGLNSQEQDGQSGHTGPSEEARRRARNLQIATGSACAFFGASYILYRNMNVKAAEATATGEVCVCVCVLINTLVLISINLVPRLHPALRLFNIENLGGAWGWGYAQKIVMESEKSNYIIMATYNYS